MSDCLFCRIVKGEISADRVADSDRALAFRDIDPKAPSHVLVIPKVHIENIHMASADDGPDVMAMVLLAQKVAEKEGIAERGYRLVFNVGDDAGNSVGHLHGHVLGGRSLAWPPG